MKILRLKENTKGRDFIIGDLHGMFDLLFDNLIEVDFDGRFDRLFSVGDLTDRGKYNVQCVELCDEPWFFAVQGNHDRMMMTWLNGNWSSFHRPSDFINNGGEWILDVSPDLHKYLYETVARNPILIEVEGRNGFRVTHSKYYKGCELHNPDAVVWGRELYYDLSKKLEDNDTIEKFKNTHSQLWMLSKFDKRSKIVYVGHNPIRNGHTIFIDRHLMIDTYAYGSGILTMVEHKSMLAELRKRN
jgi:serine/threonine protein phosphatase 1